MRQPLMVAVLAVAATLTLLVGCASAPGATIARPATSDEPTTSMGSINEVPGDLIEAIVADAAERVGVNPDEVQVLTAEAVTWSDGSLGCPEPGMMYTQALVPGYRVVVEAGGEEMSFHASDRGNFRFCQNPKPPLERNPNE